MPGDANQGERDEPDADENLLRALFGISPVTSRRWFRRAGVFILLLLCVIVVVACLVVWLTMP